MSEHDATEAHRPPDGFTPAPADPPRQLGDFRLLREVGRGGMGVVYEAVQVSLGRRVALKVLRAGAEASADALERFRREAQAVAGLHHTNIVPLFASGCEQGVHYFAMQFIDGQSLNLLLSQCRQENKQADVREVARWGLQAAEALAHAHQRGIIHRDVKPSNLLLDVEGNLWLTDFGLARRAEEASLTASGAVLGTPRYMSPEQARATDAPVDHRTDVYSLGATLYELLAGRPACDGASPREILAQIVHSEPPALRGLRPDIPADLETVVHKCLAKEPAGRYATAGDLAEDLRAFLDGRPIKARRPTPAERAIRWLRQRRQGVTLSGVTTFVLLFLAAAAAIAWRGYEEYRQGYLVLTTDGPPLEAVLLPEGGDDEIMRFRVPTAKPIPIPAGIYRVRLEEPGTLSETYTLLVERGGQTEYKVALQNQRPGRPPPAHATRWIGGEPTGPDRRADLLHLSEQGLRRSRADTGETLWETSLDRSTQPALDGATRFDWRRAVRSPERMNRLGYVIRHLDDDGIADALFLPREPAGALAVSGKTGQVLWWHDLGPGPAAPAAAAALCGPCPNACLDMPLSGPQEATALFSGTTDPSDHGKVSDVYLAVFFDRPQPQARLLALSGRTGAVLWEQPVGERPQRAQVVRWRGERALQVTAGAHVLLLNPQTGAPLQAPLDLGTTPPILPPQALVTPGEETRLYHVRAGSKLSKAPERWTEAELVVRDLAAPGRVLWSLPFQAPQANAEHINWPAVGDLDGDGQPEFVLPCAWPAVNDTAERDDRKRWRVGVQAVDSEGRLRWRRCLWVREHLWAAPPNFGHIGPDIDGDGVKDLVVATTGGTGGSKLALVVEALSGADGRTLWWWRQELPTPTFSDAVGEVVPWQRGRDGLPTLAVQLMGTGGRPLLGVFEASTGRLLNTLPELGYVARTEDVAGSGIPALTYFNVERGETTHEWVNGTSVERWRWLGDWRPMGDFKREGVPALVESQRYHMLAISGKTGTKLWEAAIPDVWQFSQFYRAPVPGLTRAGAVLSLGPIGDARFPIRLHAHAGEDGHQLWSSADLRPGGQENYLVVVHLLSEDWHGEGVPQVLLAADVLGPDQKLREQRLTLISGDTGQVRWHHSLGNNGTRAPHFDVLVTTAPGHGPVVLAHQRNLDEDGRLVALDLRTGEPVWQAPLFNNVPGEPVRTRITLAAGAGGSPLVTCTQSNGDVQAFALADGRQVWLGPVDVGPYNRELLTNGGRKGGVWVLLWFVPPEEKDGRPGDLPFRLKRLDAATGKVAEEYTLPRPPGPQAETFKFADADGDGEDDLCYVAGRTAAVFSLARGRPLWNRELSGPTGDLHEVKNGVVVVKSGDVVLGLAGDTGRVLWRCDGPGEVTAVLDNPEGGAPAVVYRAHKDASGTVCREANRINDRGEREWPTPRLDPHPAPPDPRMGWGLIMTEWEFIWYYFVSSVMTFAVVGVPLLLVVGWWRWGGWRWWPILAAWLLLVGLAFLVGLMPEEKPEWQAKGKVDWAREFYTGWLPEAVQPVDSRLVRVVAGWPGVAFTLMLVWWLAARRWRLLGILLVLSVVVGAAHGTHDYWRALAWHEPEEYYQWEHAWRLWFTGLHDTGLGLPVILLLIVGLRALYRRWRKRRPTTPAAPPFANTEQVTAAPAS